MVRDFKYRGYSSFDTLKRWQSVRRGEEKHIFPFQEEADAIFNSALLYEFAILIDDRTKNTVPWEAAGGVAILHEAGNAKKTIKELQERFGFPKR